MAKVYVYGGDKFKNRVEKLLDSQGVNNYDIINTLDMIKELIKSEPKEYFLIDEQKIYEPLFIYKWLKFLIPKDAIESTLLKENGHYDINFSSIDNAVRYISLQQSMNTQENIEEQVPIKDESDTLDDVDAEVQSAESSEVIEEEVEETSEPRDLSTLTDIDDIDDTEMQEAISETQIN